MSITFKRFSYLSERAKVMEKLHQDLTEAIAAENQIDIDELTSKIVFESQFFAPYLHSLLVEVHISQFAERSI